MYKGIRTLLAGLFAAIVLIVVSLFFGYLWGRGSCDDVKKVERITEVKWERGETVRDTIFVPKPYKVIVAQEQEVKPKVEFETADTTELRRVWDDYNTERKYKLDFSNDSIGEYKVNAVVRGNTLVEATSEVTPRVRTIQEKEVIYKQIKLQPWVMIGTSVDFKSNKVQAGVDIQGRYMVGATAFRHHDMVGYTIDIGIKF